MRFTEEQIDRINLALTNLMLQDEGREPTTAESLQEFAEDSPVEAANRLSKVAKFAETIGRELVINSELYYASSRGFCVTRVVENEGIHELIFKFQNQADLSYFNKKLRILLDEQAYLDGLN